MNAPPPLLEVKGLTRAPWFRDFDLSVTAGEIVVIRGASGSGKTLLLRAIADLDPTEGGHVSLEGTSRESVSAPAWRSRAVYVHPEGARLSGTVATNLLAVATLSIRKDAIIATSIETLPADSSTTRLSSGEAQVLALARALACEPSVLLLDESTSSMDSQRAQMWESKLVEWVSGGGRAIVWVTHDDALAARVGARVVSFP